MKVTFIADTHTQENKLKLAPGDILVHAGDTDCRTINDVVLLNKWFKEQPFSRKIFVPGNHDFIFDRNYELCKQLMTDVILLNNELVEINGIKIWGSPITPEFGDWAFMSKRGDEIKRYWDMIPDDINILVTHGPPHGILDKADRNGHVGCFDLLYAMKRVKPKIHVFGHIHEGYGVEMKSYKDKDVIFINASVVNEWYDLVNQPIKMEV